MGPCCHGLRAYDEACVLMECNPYPKLYRIKRGAGKPEAFNVLDFTYICTQTRWAATSASTASCSTPAHSAGFAWQLVGSDEDAAMPPVRIWQGFANNRAPYSDAACNGYAAVIAHFCAE